MSKELTEQWRNGTLPEGWYYIKEDEDIRISPCSRHYLLGVLKDCEVLGPVPSYKEWQALKGTHQKITQSEKKLDITMTALKEIEDIQ